MSLKRALAGQRRRMTLALGAAARGDSCALHQVLMDGTDDLAKAYQLVELVREKGLTGYLIDAHDYTDCQDRRLAAALELLRGVVIERERIARNGGPHAIG